MAGIAGGTIATVSMSAVMLGAQRLGLLGRMPPEIITEEALRRAERRAPPPRARRLAGAAAHFAFGAAAGALYAWGSERLGRRGPAYGVAYGTAVWLASYAGWIPALGILPPPPRDRRGRPTSMLVAHWVYGATLDAVARRAG